MDNSAVKKFNIEQLSGQQEEQLDLINHYIQSSLKKDGHHIAVIEGDAGTGKSVVLTKLFQQLKAGAKKADSPYYETNSIFTVNHPELLKVYQEMSAELPNLRKKDYIRPTSLINSAHKNDEKYDVVLIDEGHLLLSKPEPYVKFTQQNQLAEIIKLAKVVVVVFDFKQVMQTKMYWDRKLLKKVLAPYDYQVFNFNFQYRMNASQAVMDWVNELSEGKLVPVPKDLGHYDLRIFNRAADIFAVIKEKNKEVGLSRMVATTGFEKGDDGRHHVMLDDFDQPWDELDPQPTPWAERPESINEVGSIYTIQGFDLNYVGVLLGPPFEYDAEHDRMTVNPSKVTHTEIYKRRPGLTDPKEIAEVKRTVMFNALNILLKRGTRGLYITAADPALRKRLLKLQ
ncbi:DUF2075 domain-containing protein [Eupransor demetentiae]|uniref:DUF2075 family (BH3996) n=1 Tax=Eupransor demetentiae TaxID=3109584 RepID=A0ABM9N6T5_9LACO|nr:DUF2075 family (BH3996) [Lactobacillaceae bacterium LMG 33000]